MTLKEKLAMEEPECITDVEWGGVVGCPCDYAYLNRPDLSCWSCDWDSDEKCTECWNQEFKPTESAEKENENMSFTMEPVKTKKTKTQLVEEMNELKKELAKLEKYRQYGELAGELYAILESFTNAGFTREEAFSMIMVAMKTTMRK